MASQVTGAVESKEQRRLLLALVAAIFMINLDARRDAAPADHRRRSADDRGRHWQHRDLSWLYIHPGLPAGAIFDAAQPGRGSIAN